MNPITLNTLAAMTALAAAASGMNPPGGSELDREAAGPGTPIGQAFVKLGDIRGQMPPPTNSPGSSPAPGVPTGSVRFLKATASASSASIAGKTNGNAEPLPSGDSRWIEVGSMQWAVPANAPESSGLAKVGTGTLTLGAANTYAPGAGPSPYKVEPVFVKSWSTSGDADALPPRDLGANTGATPTAKGGYGHELAVESIQWHQNAVPGLVLDAGGHSASPLELKPAMVSNYSLGASGGDAAPVPPGTGKTLTASLLGKDSRPGTGFLRSMDGGNVVYVAGASGGVWKTTDGGASWAPAPSIDVETQKLSRMIDRRPSAKGETDKPFSFTADPRAASLSTSPPPPTAVTGRITGVAVDPSDTQTPAPRPQVKAPTGTKKGFGPWEINPAKRLMVPDRRPVAPPSGRSATPRPAPRAGRR